MSLLISDAKTSTIELRVLVGALSAGATKDLRCEVRENLISLLQQEYPDGGTKMTA